VAGTNKEVQEDAWRLYQSVQLSPEQKTAARAELAQIAGQARRDGVYDELKKMIGKVKWSVTWEELRKDDD
jgi:hypothetical protein